MVVGVGVKMFCNGCDFSIIVTTKDDKKFPGCSHEGYYGHDTKRMIGCEYYQKKSDIKPGWGDGEPTKDKADIIIEKLEEVVKLLRDININTT
jgi:hypothetical protein